MKKVFIVAAMIACTASFVSCMQNVVVGKGDKVSEQRDLPAFTSVDISAAVDATITMDNSATPAVELSGYRNVFQYIKTEIRGNTLHVYMDKNVRIDGERGVNVHIRMPELTALSISGVSDVDIKNAITGNEFTLTVSGAGDIDIDDIRVQKFTTSLSGAGDLTIKNGATDFCQLPTFGCGRYRCLSIDSKNCCCFRVRGWRY